MKSSGFALSAMSAPNSVMMICTVLDEDYGRHFIFETTKVILMEIALNRVLALCEVPKTQDTRGTISPSDLWSDFSSF